MIYNREKREIILNRELSNLDKLVIDFIRVLEKYAEYVIISGYVSILLGRTRTTEDVDVFIKPFSYTMFLKLYEELDKAGFWCLNAEKAEEIFSYLTGGLAVRFSLKGDSIPNFEVKFPKDILGKETFEDSINVILPDFKLRISALERHIAFKRAYLGSDKDLEDAKHIEEIFKEQLDYNKINKIENILKRQRGYG